MRKKKSTKKKPTVAIPNTKQMQKTGVIKVTATGRLVNRNGKVLPLEIVQQQVNN